MSPIYLPHPIRPPTGEEGRVIFWVVFLLLVGFGAVCLYYGYRAPAEKTEQATKLIHGGYAFIAGGVGMVVIRSFFTGY